MSAFSRIIIYLGFILIASSCAQVGTISGGDIDDVAPEIKKMSPKNETVYFKGNGFEIEFKDFIKLNNPNQTIAVIPPDFKVKTEIKGKTLFLSWDEALQENTTYSIFLNKTVTDLTEGNDSIMQIVFSTGEYLDSLSYVAFVKDALTGAPIKGTLVGLFQAEDSLKPMYFSETNVNGQATFNYLKKGSYYLKAFEDVNKDLKISKTERIGFKNSIISLNSSMVDSLPLSLFTPLLAPNVNTFNFLSPGAFLVGANRSLKDAKMEVNGAVLDDSNTFFITEDSLMFFHQPGDSKSVILSVNGEHINDTTTVRLTDASKNKPLNLVGPKSNVAYPKENIVFTVLDEIKQVDTSMVHLVSLPDSLPILDYSIELSANKLIFSFNHSAFEKVLLAFDAGAVIGKTGSESIQSIQEIALFKANELGILNLDLSAYEENVILEVISGGKSVQKVLFSETKKKQLSNLKPGDYTFKVTLDSNKNGRWDTGDFTTKSQPEEIQLFTEPTKVRANWEIELIIVPKK